MNTIKKDRNKPLPRLIIIGAGIAGMKMASRLDKKQYQVVLIDKNERPSSQPFLYQLLSPGTRQTANNLPSAKKVEFIKGEVLKIESQHSSLITSEGPMNYDYLIIATGNRKFRFQKNGDQEPGNDLHELRAHLHENFNKLCSEKETHEIGKYSNLVIEGGSITGVELAGALSEFRKQIGSKKRSALHTDMQIHLIEPSGKLLPGMSKTTSLATKYFLDQMNVKVWLNTSVKNFADEKVVLDDCKTINTNTFITTKASYPKSFVERKENGIPVNRKINVNQYHQVRGYSTVFAIGDAAFMNNNDLIEPLPESTSAAIQQALNLSANLNNEKGVWKKFNFRSGGEMILLGRNKAIIDFRHFHFEGIIACYLWWIIHFFQLSGIKNTGVIVIDWFKNFLPFRQRLSESFSMGRKRNILTKIFQLPVFSILRDGYFHRKKLS